MTIEQLTAVLADRVMGWKVAGDRFMKRNRSWMPRWRFRPAEKIEDAFRLLEEAAPQEYTIGGDDKGNFQVRVRIRGATGEACGAPKPFVITCAIARAIGIEVDQ